MSSESLAWPSSCHVAASLSSSGSTFTKKVGSMGSVIIMRSTSSEKSLSRPRSASSSILATSEGLFLK